MAINKKFILIISFASFGSFLFAADFCVANSLANGSQIVFNEQRKYIGQEYDADTGLDYLNARYYDAKRGQFISQDPLVRDNPEKFLADPQQLNDYAYARNNPINASDPSGLKAYFSPGFADPTQARVTTISPGIPGVMSWMKEQFGSAEFYGWSQRDNARAFNNAAQGLANKVMAENKPGDPIDFVAHSDGGIVEGKAAQILKSKGFNVRNVVMGGTPIRPGDFNLSGVQNAVMAYNNDDPIQNRGGNLLTASGLVGGGLGLLLCGAPCGMIGFGVGSLMSKGEIGPAGRTLPEASNVHNINVTQDINSHPEKTGIFYEHGNTIFNQAVMNRLSGFIQK